ncbi:helix-turn-helix domain-containing protein [Bradyrhizobium sp. KB893862 SZCCT0404]|uniref:AraC-like ligand-binding domain-containing protein n=1 Tax=Bradyrhizobium sp. KB893862 SZCCT0404 TaxID=2807672 RepID=UPI001BA686FC|nr:helix-turn-helix domain-containing protein [Bradyrhizobium sp. KB893862 SZCCT0404]MBR1176987.1 helix-turn-helix domain-containing protein [Bradyrhizobium sp. KB893862 SZCCT0404]
MQKCWSTDTLAEHERLAYWVEAVCDTYVQLDCDAPDREAPFHGTIELETLATLGLSRVTAAAQVVRRTPEKIARATEDYFLVSIQTAGRGTVVQDGRAAELGPGDFALYDSTRPYDLIFEGNFQQYVLRLPGQVLRARLRNAHSLTAQAVCGARGAGHLMISMINALAADMDTLERSSFAAIAESVENILVAGLCSLPGASTPEASCATAFHRDQIKVYAQDRLRDPRLSVAKISAALRLSPSTVHRVFEGEPQSLSSWIWAQRLEGAKRDLCNPSLDKRTVSEIAFSWGFNDAAHFSRAFRSRFGCSAREMRTICAAADKAPVPSPKTI